MRGKKIYIAGKITGLKPHIAKKKFLGKQLDLERRGYEVVNPMEFPHNHDKKWESYMKECIKALMDCDSLYAMKCWKDSAGAEIEVALAYRLNIEIIYQTESKF